MDSQQNSLPLALMRLSEIQEHINEVRRQNELTCHDIAQLLNKPWPGKMSPASAGLTRTQEGGRDSASAPEKLNKDNVFSFEEQSMLAEVDSVLAQAQKLRNFQSKVKSKQTSHDLGRASAVSANAPNHVETSKPIEVAEPSLPSDQQKNEEIPGEAINRNTNNSEAEASDVAVISAKDLDRLLKKEPPIRKEQTSRMTRPTSGSSKLSNQPKSKKSTTAAAGVPRPAPRKGVQLRTSSAEIGRHVSKPATRYGDTQSRYMQSAKVKTLHKNDSRKPTKPSTQLSGNRSNVRQSSSQGQIKQASATKRLPDEVSIVPSGKGISQVEQPSRTQRTDSNEVEKVTHSVAHLKVSQGQKGRSEDTQQEMKSILTTKEDPTPQSETIPFILRKDGSSLTVPSKLKKHYQNTTRLRDKLTSLVQEDARSHSDCFLRLFGDNSLSFSHLDGELQRLVAEFRHLIELTRNVRKQLKTIHGKTHWEDVYYLSSMSEVIRQRQDEITKQFSELKECFNDDHDDRVSRSSHKKTEGFPFLWHQGNTFKDACLSIPEGNILQYSSRVELLTWNRLVYQIQLIQQEKIIQEVAGSAILELLSGINSSDPSYPTLYRIAHGVIFNSGSIYPSMISDEERGTTPCQEGSIS
ncbi:uncharacterized protein LOC121422811 [Lytechinus variegatus]|uniref:uncharacterized protein LOC121422811 n=1 Tax=Lytechinus variegatus TaxID=7654 RepID=UPI001BB2C08A|nr:uncharacterized protein LOC121422811 [Lytechinus variegatus]